MYHISVLPMCHMTAQVLLKLVHGPLSRTARSGPVHHPGHDRTSIEKIIIPLNQFLPINHSRQRAEDSVHSSMKEPIATPIGLYMAGYSGAGGDYIPLKAINRQIYQRLPNGILFGLKINTGSGAPTQDSMIIDVIFDNEKESTLHDPHIIQQVTDYPVDQATRGIVWFGTAKPPGYTQYSKYGIHTVAVKVAPRTAPASGTASADQTLDARDFSPEAGGQIAEFTFEITKGPILPPPDEGE